METHLNRYETVSKSKVFDTIVTIFLSLYEYLVRYQMNILVLIQRYISPLPNYADCWA